jgi:hypothetical protein
MDVAKMAGQNEGGEKDKMFILAPGVDQREGVSRKG